MQKKVTQNMKMGGHGVIDNAIPAFLIHDAMHIYLYYYI